MGVAANPVANWHTTLDVFYLHLKSELVFSGDAGDTEPSGATTREGVEWGNTWHINRLVACRLQRGLLPSAVRQERGPG